MTNPYEAPIDAVEVSPPSVNASSDNPSPDSYPWIFEASGSLWTTAYLPILGGVFVVAIGLLSFVVNLLFVSGSNQILLHATSTAPVIAGTFLIINGCRGLSAVRQIRIWQQGIEIVRSQTETISWDHVAGVRRGDSSSPGAITAKIITICGSDGEPLAKVAGSLAAEDRVMQAIEQHINLAGAMNESVSSSVSSQASHDSRRKGKRSAIFVGPMGVLLGIAGVMIPYWAYQEKQNESALAERGVSRTAVVDEAFVAPNGRTKRIRFSVVDDGGKVSDHNVEVTEETFTQMQEGSVIEIRTLADDSSVVRLAAGEVIDTDPANSLPVSIGLGIFGLLACLFMVPTSVLMWKGYDINFNDGKFQVVPIS